MLSSFDLKNECPGRRLIHILIDKGHDFFGIAPEIIIPILEPPRGVLDPQ